jgi:Adenosylmethionine decarboxylase
MCPGDVAPSPPFEGSEKRLEVHFFADEGAPADGLRAISRRELDRLLSLAACEIVSHTRADAVDAYVLSESSLFVFPHRWIIKTCGTTRLLSCLDVRACPGA